MRPKLRYADGDAPIAPLLILIVALLLALMPALEMRPD